MLSLVYGAHHLVTTTFVTTSEKIRISISSYKSAQIDGWNKTVRRIFGWSKFEGREFFEGGQIGHPLRIVPMISQRAVLLFLECVCATYTLLN